MKKIFALLFVCALMVMSVTTAFATDTFAFEYLVWKESTGSGKMILQYQTTTVTLSDSGEMVDIPKGETVQMTIKADPGCEISAVVYNGAPLNYERPATEINMKIDNYSGNNSVKVTYDKAEYLCSTTSVGNGKVTINTPATDESSVKVPVGGNFGFTVEADKNNEVVSVSINGEEVDLSRFGKNETNKVTKFSMEIPDVREDTMVSVVFSNNTSTKYGDVKQDSKVNVTDATTIQKSVAGLIEIDSQQTLNADVDADSRVTVKDATTVQKFVAGIISSFPAEKNNLIYGSAGDCLQTFF